MNYNYSSNRLDELAKNILIGMGLVDKRVDRLGGKKVKKELTEEEQLMAIKETQDFFNKKENQTKLEELKKLIVDNQYQNKLQKLYDGASNTPQSMLYEMNAPVTYNPYNEK